MNASKLIFGCIVAFLISMSVGLVYVMPTFMDALVNTISCVGLFSLGRKSREYF